MKQILLILAVIAAASLAFAFCGTKAEKPILTFSVHSAQKPLRIVYYQDITYSIRSHGVEVVKSDLFSPFFQCTDRTIELNYGVISRSSARKLITASLPSFGAKKPIKPDFNQFSITERADLARDYEHALEQYQFDSLSYWRSRNREIERFCRVSDSLTTALNIPSEQGSTDIITAVEIADRAFNTLDSSGNYLILNTDGLDSHYGRRTKLLNTATVMLINAGRNQKTCLDGIEPKTFQSSEQALQFIFSQQNIRQ